MIEITSKNNINTGKIRVISDILFGARERANHFESY